MPEPSVFTRIINGEIPCYKVYEDERTFSFLDIHPIAPGHTLVIPKVQVDQIWDLRQEDYDALMAAVQRVAQRMKKVLPQQRVGVKVVGENVPHTHVHLIPFDTVEQYDHHPDLSAEPDHEALKAMAAKLAF